MRTVYKYTLDLTSGIQERSLPTGAKIMHVNNQDGRITLWAEVETSNEHEMRRFMIYGTGHEIDPSLTIVGTVLMDRFVWHVYEGNGN